MKQVKLLNGELINVVNFDDKTNKEYPYYQNKGSRYACCPFCHSVVNIKGGHENKNQSTQKSMYASHHMAEVDGFEIKDYKNCPFYKGNKDNWQGVYQVNESIEENKELKSYIEDNQTTIAEELSELTGISFKNQEGVNSLFEEIKNSFINNNGLHRKNWHPDMVSRIILVNSAPVKFWGYKVISDDIVDRIKRNNIFSNSLVENNQFKHDDVTFVATMDNNEDPQNIDIKLIRANDETLILRNISAKSC